MIKFNSNRIGDYIHWKYNNYLEYGLGVTEKKSVSPEEALQRQRAIVKAEITKNRSASDKVRIKNELLNRLNFLYATGPATINNVTYTEQEMQEIRTRIINIVQSRMKTGNFNFSTLTGTQDDKLGILETKLRNLAQNDTNWLDAIYERLRLMIQERDKIGGMIQSGNGNLDNWSVELNEAIASFNNIISKIGVKLNASGVNIGREDFIKLLQDNGVSRRAKGYSSLATQVNRLINTAKKAADANLTGDVAEWYSAIAIALGSQYGREQQLQLLKDLENGLDFSEIGAIGKSSSMAIKITDNFTVKGFDRNQRKNLGTYFLDFGSNQLKATSTQDKVDLTISLGQGEMIGASIKNYDLSSKTRKIHILNGADLLNYIQEYYDFVNHYLNLTVDGTTSESYRPAKAIAAANTVMALTIALKALAGNVYKMDSSGNIGKSAQAEIFIVHDNSQTMGGFNIYFMDDIINKLELMANRIFDYIEIDNFSQGTTWSMDWEEAKNKGLNRQSAYQRILKLLKKLSAFKLSVSISQPDLI